MSSCQAGGRARSCGVFHHSLVSSALFFHQDQHPEQDRGPCGGAVEFAGFSELEGEDGACAKKAASGLEQGAEL